MAKVARFLANQNGEDFYTFMVTGRYRPRYTLKKNQVVRLRHLTATIENRSSCAVPTMTKSLISHGALHR